VKHRSKWQGICVGVLGVALTLAPVSMAAASSNKGKHHSNTSTKGSAPGSAMCKDVKNEQTGSSTADGSFEKAIESGNFAAAKQAMLNAFAADQTNVQKALSVIKTAPANVQAAFKNLLTFVQQIKTDIQNASNEQDLITSFSSLGKDPKLATDAATISNWYTGVCGGTLVTPTTTSSSLPF
jgi:flagellum-specific peptidoglycan hydrolase FlgJ